MASRSSLRIRRARIRKPPNAKPATVENANRTPIIIKALIIRSPILSRREGTYWSQEIAAWYRTWEISRSASSRSAWSDWRNPGR